MKITTNSCRGNDKKIKENIMNKIALTLSINTFNIFNN